MLPKKWKKNQVQNATSEQKGSFLWTNYHTKSNNSSETKNHDFFLISNYGHLKKFTKKYWFSERSPKLLTPSSKKTAFFLSTPQIIRKQRQNHQYTRIKKRTPRNLMSWTKTVKWLLDSFSQTNK